MGEYYHQFLSSMSGAGLHTLTTPDELQSNPFASAQMPMTAPVAPSSSMPGTPIVPQYPNMAYFSGIPEPVVLNPARAQKGRRKSGAGVAGADHVKHRRTRSGCFMCRSRRVKCDETRPVCERCRKGNRECVYPEPPASRGGNSQASRSKDAGHSTRQTSPASSGGQEDEDEDTTDDRIPEEQSDSTSSVHAPRSASISSINASLAKGRQGSETPSWEGGPSSSPSVSSFSTAAAYQPSDYSFSLRTRADWSHVPADLQRYLDFFMENLTHYHYCMPLDHDDSIKTLLPQIAVRNEALLNAVVGFSAYHATLMDPDGKVQNFLQYYNKSVTQLLASLQKKEKRDVATLLTILQLASIEEYLGDWVNLMGHQKAAFEMITKIFTPQNVMQTPMGRLCLHWYARFDTFVAIMGGFPTDLPREWFTAMVSFNQSQRTANPDALRWRMDERMAHLRVINYDMSIVFAKGSRGQLSPAAFVQEHDKLSERLMTWKQSWHPSLSDPKYRIADFSYAQPVEPDDIVDPYSSDVLFDHPLFSTTMITAEWHSVMIMHKCQSASTSPDVLFAELRELSYTVCQMFEMVQFWPGAPKGVMVMMHAYISIAALFLPQDDRHHMWLRRKFAFLEGLGYIYPLSLRTKMAELFREPACVQWWLPNNEGFGPVLKSIREFADERNAAAVTAQQESLREVRHIFAKLELSDQAMEMSGTAPDSTN